MRDGGIGQNLQTREGGLQSLYLEMPLKLTTLTFAASIMLDAGFFFVHTDLVFVFADTLMGVVIVVTEGFRLFSGTWNADTGVLRLTCRLAHSIIGAGNVDTGIVIWNNERRVVILQF